MEENNNQPAENTTIDINADSDIPGNIHQATRNLN